MPVVTGEINNDDNDPPAADCTFSDTIVEAERDEDARKAVAPRMNRDKTQKYTRRHVDNFMVDG